MTHSWPLGAKFQFGDHAAKKGRASWRGKIVGWYSTNATALGYAIESHFEPGSVQIYPETAIETWTPLHAAESPLSTQLALFARYHGWATRRLLASIANLPEDTYRKDSGLFFGSVHATLNHLLLTDAELWYPRFAEGRSPALALNAEIEADRTRLAERLREATDRWPTFLSQLPASQIDGALTYRTTQGIERQLPYAAALIHFFNHGTHHRGQITAAISAAGYAFEPLDLLILIGAEAQAR